MKAFFLILLGTAGGLFAAGLPITLTTKEGNISVSEIVGGSETSLQLSVNEGKGKMAMPLESLKSWKFTAPPEWNEAGLAIRNGKLDVAERVYRKFAMQVMPFLGIPKGDAERYFFAYTDLLRSSGKYKEALDALTQLPDSILPSAKARQAIARAYCLAQTGKLEEADRQINLLRAPSRESALFTPYFLARSSLLLAQSDYIAALDDIAQIMAFKRISSEGYAEALYLNAEAYDALDVAIAKQKEEIKKNERLSRQYQADSNAVFKELDLIKSDTAQVSAIMDSPKDLPKSAQAIRRQLLRLYPDSSWAEKARAKLPPDQVEAINNPTAPEDSTPVPGKPTKTSPASPKKNTTPNPVDDGKIDTDIPTSEDDNL